MKFKVAIRNPRIRSSVGAALAILCGLALWQMTLGERWVNASYDYLFRFGERKVTNKVALIQMQRQGSPPKPWDRRLHTALVNRLADDQCPLVVFDIFFQEASDSLTDAALLMALQRLNRVALMAWQTEDPHSITPSAHVEKPAAAFLAATKTNFGVAWFKPDLDDIVRKHWPDLVRVQYPSLSSTAAKLAGATLSDQPQRQWLRYYGFRGRGAWEPLTYLHATNKVAGYFRDKIVFIGNQPKTSVPDGEEDEFRTPYTRWEGDGCGGVEIVATAFLNLVNQEWLRRPAWPIEGAMLLLSGGLLGGFLCRLRPRIAFAVAIGSAIGVGLGAVVGSHVTNFWFPWLIVAGGQVPCALVWAWVTRPRHELSVQDLFQTPWKPPVPDFDSGLDEVLVDASNNYEIINNAPFAQGSFGKVWLVRNATGQFQALKGVYEAKFGEDCAPYELEFKGISNYKPISDKHPGLLRVDFVSPRKLEGFFYYVMDLGDAITPGWETDPKTYKPRDLASVIRQAERNRLPVTECIRIVGLLAEALDFLHQQRLIHRDIKPSNIIFIDGRPKLADVGLVREIRPPVDIKTIAGTLGYMPPPPEKPGTVPADIYALGMVLYVMSTGKQPALFPELSSTLHQTVEGPEFIRLNSVILKACDTDLTRRFASAAEFCAALAEVQKLCEKSSLHI